MAFLLQFLTIKKNIGSNFFKFARGDFPHSVEHAQSRSLTQLQYSRKQLQRVKWARLRRAAFKLKEEIRRKEEAARKKS